MKKLLVCFLLIASPLFATIAQISHTSAGSTTSNGITTSSISTTGASLITIQVVSYVGAAEPALTESTGNITFTACGSVQATSAEERIHAYHWVVTNSNQTSATHTFTATQTGSFPTILVQSWSGTSTSTPCDQTTGANTGAGTATTLATGNITPSENNELVITATGVKDTRAMSVDGGFTEQDEVTMSANHYGGSMGYLIQTTATAANPTWATNGAASGLAVTIASFKSATASTPASVLRRRRN